MHMGEEDIQLHSFLNVALDKREWWASCHGHFANEEESAVHVEHEIEWDSSQSWESKGLLPRGYQTVIPWSSNL